MKELLSSSSEGKSLTAGHFCFFITMKTRQGLFPASEGEYIKEMDLDPEE